MPKKDEIYWKILNSALILELRHGHQKWTMTRLARASGVSRTLIYYYFGRSKLDILGEAVSLFGVELAGATAERRELWKQGRLAETFLATRRLVERSPALVPFYFLNRAQDSALGRAIRKQEEAFRSKLAAFFPSLSATRRDAAFALFFGIPFCGELSEKAVREALELLSAGLGKS